MFSTIAVGTDGSETATVALETALDLAAHYTAKLVIMSAYQPDPHARASLEEPPESHRWMLSSNEHVDATLADGERRAQDRGVEASAVAREGDPATVICELAAEWDVDLIVVGNKGMDRRLLGSVPNTVSHTAPCSVVIVKTTDRGTALQRSGPGSDGSGRNSTG